MKKHRNSEKNLDDWLMTYADMITLLLCFFTILLAISIPKQGKYEQAKKRVAEQFASRTILDQQLMTTQVYEAQPVDRGLMTGMQSMIALNGVQSEVMINENNGSYTIELNSIPFFGQDSATLTDEGKWVLNEVLKKLKEKIFNDYHITIEGYTSDVPPSSQSLFPSNWELSTARSIAVLRYFLDNGIPPQKLSASGYADTFPKLPNRKKDGTAIPENQTKNQRVVIRLRKPDPPLL